MPDANPALLTHDAPPKKIINRVDTHTTLKTNLPSINIHLTGPRGTGKTLLADAALTNLNHPSCYLDATDHNTPFKVLTALAQQLTPQSQRRSQSQAELRQDIRDAVNAPTIVAIDNIEFLTYNRPGDTDDLLYSLGNTDQLRILTIGTTDPALSDILSDRHQSRLQLQTVQLDPYTQEEAYHIYNTHSSHSLGADAVTSQALSQLSEQTQNISLGLCWLYEAAALTDKQITADTLDQTGGHAVQRYHDQLLSSFSDHHHFMYEAVQNCLQQTEGDGVVTTGTVYPEYQNLCQVADTTPHSQRRATEYLDHLDLLDILEIDKYLGGAAGKTRKIQLQELFQ